MRYSVLAAYSVVAGNAVLKASRQSGAGFSWCCCHHASEHDKVSEHVNILSDGSLGYKELISCDDGHEPLHLTPSLPNSVLATSAVSHQNPGATGVINRQAYAEQSQVGGIIIKAGKAPSLAT
jgi:hypothetical protein